MSDKIKIKDFDKIIPPKRIIKLAGKEFDVSKVPSRVSLELAKFRDEITEYSSEEAFLKSLDFVIMVCKKSDPDITVDWLLDNTHFEEMMEFVDFVLEPITSRIEGKKK